MKVDGIKNIDYLVGKQKKALAFDESRDFAEY